MKKALIIACIWILCFIVGFADALRLQVNQVPVLVTTLTTTGAVTVESSFTMNQADPAIIFNGSTGIDTDFWIGLTADEEADDDDIFQIGKGVTKGTTPFISWNKDGGFTAENINDATTGYLFNTSDSAAVFRIDTTNGQVIIGSGTKHDGYVIRDAAEVQTTDATVTVLDNVTLLDENTYHFKAIVIGVQSDGTDRATYHIEATVYRTGAGGATLQGEPTSVHTQESNASLAATFTVNSNDIRVSVTGIAAETWEWGTTMKYMNMSN